MMRVIKEVNILEDKRLIIWLNIWTVILFILFSLIMVGISYLKGDVSEIINYDGFWEFIFVFGLYFLLIIVHELIYGLFFKIFNPDGKVQFGFKNGMAYATSPDSIYPKGKFSIIILAPFILISLGLYGAYLLNCLSWAQFCFVVVLHSASCVGDFYYIKLILELPKGALVKDTLTGISFYQS